jgi:hypothetical protein
MAASTTRAKKQQLGDSRQATAASFDAMHDALASEAHDVARDFGVDVLTIAFRPDHAAGRADDAPRAVVHEFLGVAHGAMAGGGGRVGHGAGGAGRARGAAAGPQGHPRPPSAGDDDGEETGARPLVESRSISPGAARSKAAEDFEGRKKKLSSDYHVRGIDCI